MNRNRKRQIEIQRYRKIANVIWVVTISTLQNIPNSIYLSSIIHLSIYLSIYPPTKSWVFTRVSSKCDILAGWSNKQQGSVPKHLALTLSFTKYKFLQMKNNFKTAVNGLSVLILFQLLNGDLLFSQHAYSICVNYTTLKNRIKKFMLK